MAAAWECCQATMAYAQAWSNRLVKNSKDFSLAAETMEVVLVISLEETAEAIAEEDSAVLRVCLAERKNNNL